MKYNKLVSYDLIGEKNYPAIYEYLENLNGKRILESVWLINSDLSCVSIASEIKKIVDDTDKFIVYSISEDNANQDTPTPYGSIFNNLR